MVLKTSILSLAPLVAYQQLEVLGMKWGMVQFLLRWEFALWENACPRAF